MKTLKQYIKLPAVCGSYLEEKRKAVFTGYVDSDFENWNLNSDETCSKETELAVLEMTKDATFKQLFTDPEKMCMTQSQIIEFCRTCSPDLNQEWYNFFLFKVNGEFFVARVYVGDVGSLEVRVSRFGFTFVFVAAFRYRVVVPQLALETLSTESDSLTLESLDLRLKKLEKTDCHLHHFNLDHTNPLGEKMEFKNH